METCTYGSEGSAWKPTEDASERRWGLTLLDFIFKHKGKVYNYPTIIFYQVGYNLFVAWQASARHRRLIQTDECRTYYLYYSLSLQEVAVEALANKKAATSALQGTFSEEGLTAMANSVDPRVLLANALMNGAKASKMDELFEKINKKSMAMINVEEESIVKDIRSSLNSNPIEIKRDLDAQLTLDSLIMSLTIKMTEQREGRGKNAKVAGQLSLF